MNKYYCIVDKYHLLRQFETLGQTIEVIERWEKENPEDRPYKVVCLIEVEELKKDFLGTLLSGALDNLLI